MKMKIFIFLITLVYFNKISSQVVNSCGLKDTRMPNISDDCKDDEEPACKMVTIEPNGDPQNKKKFCAIVHGKYNDEQVLKEVGELIKGKVTVEGNGFVINLNYNIIIFFTIIMFL